MSDAAYCVQPEPCRPVRRYADFLAAERYAIRWLHRLRGQEMQITHAGETVAYCRRAANGHALTYTTLAWSARINLQLERLQYSAARKRKNYRFVDSDKQEILPL